MEDLSFVLHTQNPQQRFSNRAEDYAKYRPSYPAAAIDQILAGLRQPVAADVGAGTGISARLLADRGAEVWAIEPNAAMYAAAQPHPHVEFRQGSAEQTGLDPQSVNLITCCQAFHWFEPIATLAEFHRILKPGGQLALMWNERDETDSFTQEHNEIIRVAADRQFFDSPSRKSATPLAESPLFINYRAYTFPFVQSLNLESLTGLALSSSYIPKEGAAYERMIAELQALYDRWVGRSVGDFVSLAYRTSLYLADAKIL
ncbi:MAG: class I SAM-dependent methyltransferase [Timaviella obliquedivisa GSE-PSE-MK23-08B]|jgi:SAM-dependent methyltransferase|nr:class I SAM-dependent methyltransferase [Timaviella obliquedivisa GSE-PSE-MK23-08B]